MTDAADVLRDPLLWIFDVLAQFVHHHPFLERGFPSLDGHPGDIHVQPQPPFANKQIAAGIVAQSMPVDGCRNAVLDRGPLRHQGQPGAHQRPPIA
jgi:hypothetical protein